MEMLLVIGVGCLVGLSVMYGPILIAWVTDWLSD